MTEGERGATADGGGPSARFDRDFWEGRWSEVLREHAAQVAGRPPNAYLTATAGDLAPGRALSHGRSVAARRGRPRRAAVGAVDREGWRQRRCRMSSRRGDLRASSRVRVHVVETTRRARARSCGAYPYAELHCFESHL